MTRLEKVAKGDVQAKVDLTHSTDPILHMLIDVIANPESREEVKAAALESYVGRVYQTYSVRNLSVKPLPYAHHLLAASWSFFSEPDSVTFGIGPPMAEPLVCFSSFSL